jgi:exportin-T
VNQLRGDPQAWQACTNIFTRTPKASEIVRFVSLEIVNTAVHSQSLDGASLAFLKDSLLDYIRRTYSGNAEDQIDAPSVQNKLTQTLTFLFVSMYKEGWLSRSRPTTTR